VELIGHGNTEDHIVAARQALYQWAAEHGIPDSVFQFSPSAGRLTRKRQFQDANESSKSHGKRKLGYQFQVSFEIRRLALTTPELAQKLYDGGLRR
jgi:hypothetical protein